VTAARDANREVAGRTQANGGPDRRHDRGDAEEVLLANALAVRAIIARMEQAVQQGVHERLP
jgi:hypothetical protein